MTEPVIEQLTFQPASVKPTPDMDGMDVLVYNLCDGWHEGHVRVFEEDGEVYGIGIYTFMMHELTPHDFYVAWAVLPDGLKFGEHFADEKGSRPKSL